MNQPEFAGFLTKLYCQFPSLREWLHAHSPDPVRTEGMWAATLADYTIDECQDVLSQWAQMDEPPLKAYSRDAVAQLIRHSANCKREAANIVRQRERADLAREAFLESQGHTLASNMTSTLDRVLRYRTQQRDGTLDPDDAQMLIDQALTEVV